MHTDEFQQLWKAYDAKLERSMSISRRLFTELQRQKVGLELRPLLRSRVAGIVVGFVWLVVMGFCGYVVRSQPVMVISFGVFVGCTALGIAGYIRDVSVIRAVSYADSVVETQGKLAGLQIVLFRDLRLAWVQLPFWACFFVSNAFIRAAGPLLYFVELPIFLGFVVVAVVLYRNLRVENVPRKRWVAAMVRGAGSRRLARAMELLEELREFEREV
jgi:hypothetical protein